MEINTKTEVNTTVLAVVLGITSRRVQQLAQDGIIESKSRGKYLLSDSVQRYINFRLRERNESAADKEKLEAEVSIKKAKAIITVLEAKELQGKMHRSEDVAAMTEDLIYTIRSMLVSLPGRLAVDAANLSDPAKVSELVRSEVYAIMAEISQYKYDDKKYRERVRERMRWDAAANDGVDD